MNIIITGGCGFIGSNIAFSLAKQGHLITCFDNLSRRGSELILQRLNKANCEFIHGDVRNPEDFNKLVNHFDVMIECSAEPSVLVGSTGSDAYSLLNTNLIGLINCLEYCRKKGWSMIFLSTSRVYPFDRIETYPFTESDTRFEIDTIQPFISKDGVTTDFPLKGVRSLYGATKLAAEYILKEYSYSYDINTLINRLGVIAGPWQLGKVDQGVFTYWLACHYFKKPLAYIGYGGQGKQLRDLLHIDDLCNLIQKQLLKINEYKGEIFNAGGGSFSNLSLLEATSICQTITGNKVTIDQIFTNRLNDVIWYKSNNEKTSKEFNWEPKRNPESILHDIYKWLKNNENSFKKIFFSR